MRGLDPRIHLKRVVSIMMDCRVKPGNDEGEFVNIAAWLHRAGLSHPGLPAVGHGSRVTQSYGALAERAARLATRCTGSG